MLVAAQSTAFAVSSPARNAIIPRLVPPRLLPSAITLNFTTFQATMVIGPLTAGLLFARYATGTALPLAYGVDALLFTVSLWATYKLPAVPPVDPARGVGADVELGPAVGTFYLDWVIDIPGVTFEGTSIDGRPA